MNRERWTCWPPKRNDPPIGLSSPVHCFLIRSEITPYRGGIRSGEMKAARLLCRPCAVLLRQLRHDHLGVAVGVFEQRQVPHRPPETRFPRVRMPRAWLPRSARSACGGHVRNRRRWTWRPARFRQGPVATKPREREPPSLAQVSEVSKRHSFPSRLSRNCECPARGVAEVCRARNRSQR